jgi:membrane fusion protein, multidrug efflux system
LTSFHKKKFATGAALISCVMAVFSALAVAESDLQSQNMPSTKLVAVVKSLERATLSSQIEGMVTSVNYLPGERFRKGDVLLSIDCTLPNAALNKAKARVEFARNEFKSLDALHKLNSATMAEVAKSASEFAIAKADREIADYQVSHCDLRAPFDAAVVDSFVKPYESIQAKKELLDIVGTENLVVEFLASSDMLLELEPGRSVTVMISETGENYSLIIDKVVPLVDSISQTVKVISHIKSENTGLWSGMSGWVTLDNHYAQSTQKGAR